MKLPCDRRVMAIALCAVALGCADDPIGLTAPDLRSAAHDGRGLRVYNGGEDRAEPARPCLSDARYDEFDFWLGTWRAGRPDVPNPSASNTIARALDGCIVTESWTGADGIRGRSISAFDRDTRLWHQTWMQAASAFPIRIAGGRQGDDMYMSGTRTQLNGVEWFDEVRWTPLADGRVDQINHLRIGLGTLVFFEITAPVRYAPEPGMVPPAEQLLSVCQPGGTGERSRELDFWLGTWSVTTGHGTALGTASVTTDLSGCLTEEQFVTRKGVRALSFSYYDRQEQQWYRTYVDSEGERVEVHGNMVNGKMVMTGTEPGSGGGSVLVRMTLAALSSSRVRQTWETSSDGGTNWTPEMLLTYRRQ